MLSVQAIDTIREAATKTKNVEVEVRIGQYTINGSFQPGVDRHIFNSLRSSLTNVSTSYTKDEYFGEDRYSTDLNPDGSPLSEPTHMIKTRITNIELKAYNLRISVSSEVVSGKPKPSVPSQTVRYKKRFSAIFLPGYRLDLTEVTSNEKITYEVELEAENPNDLSTLDTVIQKLYKRVWDTIFIYTADERYTIISAFNTLTGSNVKGNRIDHNTLDQVRNLKLRDIRYGELIPVTNARKLMRYGVGLKPDGKKKYLFIHALGIYIMSAPQSVNKIAPQQLVVSIPTFHNSIYQGEMLSTVPPRLLLYDVISSNGQSLKGLTFVNRQDYIDKVLIALKPIGRVIQLEKKTFDEFLTAEQFFRVVNRLLDAPNVGYETDGLIIQPLDALYDMNTQRDPLQNKIMKWKPPTMLTIDFLIQRPNLLVSLGEGRLEPFLGTKEFPLRGEVDFGETVDGSIYEFKWDGTKLVAVRNRDDKPHPNRKEIALDVWDDIHQPITEEVIRGKQFSLVRRYHNRVKRNLYKSIAPVTNLLSIGSGRGGDIWKWESIQVKNVLAVEPDADNISEFVRRLTGINIKVETLQTIGQDVKGIYTAASKSNIGQFDCIEYMLSLSFLFDNDQSMISVATLCAYLLKPGGRLVILTINGDYVLEYFNNPLNRTVVKTDQGYEYRSNFKQIQFSLICPTEQLPLLTAETPCNEQYQVKINIEGTIVKEQTEYLVNLKRLDLSLTTQAKMIRIHQERVDQELFLNDEEYLFSRLFTTLVYQKS